MNDEKSYWKSQNHIRNINFSYGAQSKVFTSRRLENGDTECQINDKRWKSF